MLSQSTDSPGPFTHYEVELTSPQPSWMSRGSDPDDEIFRRDGILNTFPCSERYNRGNRELISLHPNAGDSCLGLSLPMSERTRGIDSEDLGAWEVNYWWGRFEDAPFDNGDEAYTWGSGLSRQVRSVSQGLWSSTPLEIPDHIRMLGDSGSSRPQYFNLSDLDGTKALLAVRVSEYTVSDNLESENLRPQNIANYCVFVEFTTRYIAPRDTCGRPDSIVGDPVLPVSRQPSSATPSTAATTPTTTSARTIATGTTHLNSPGISQASGNSPPGNAPQERLNTNTIVLVAVLGTVGILVFLALLCCRWRRRLKRAQKEAEDIDLSGLGGHRASVPPPCPISRNSRGPEYPRTSPAILPSPEGPGTLPLTPPSPVARPEPQLHGEYREAAERGNSNSQNVMELPPPYEGLVSPPIYEEVPRRPSGPWTGTWPSRTAPAGRSRTYYGGL